jgi:hypothetical protein
MNEDRGIPTEYVKGQIFQVEGSDRRKELITEELKTSQKPHGSDVEFYRDDVGFVLLKRESPVKYKTAMVQRAKSAAQLSLGPPRELREFYYAMRGKPELMVAFKDVQSKAIYSSVLRAIMDEEILCDLDRDVFTVGNLSKGFIYYYHSPIFGQKERKIGFTEVIARSIMDPVKEGEWQLDNCENIIVVEKNSAATRLVELGMSEYTNSIIVTTGGNFNRAVWEVASRFKERKNLIFLADADAYGVDMLRTIRVGTESSRHLPYKFPPSQFMRIFLAGFYPSIGEMLDLPNDVEEKRPLSNPYVKQRVDFLVRHGLLNEMDLKTWKNDKTYELEALSEGFTNKTGQPIGLGIYLIEYMRLYGIPVKPPIPPDEELKKEFDEAARAELKREIDEKVSYPKFFWDLYYYFTDHKEELKKRIYEDLSPQYEECLEKVTAKEIKFHIFQQFEQDPSKATYDLAAIAHKLKTEFEITVEWNMDEFAQSFEDLKGSYDQPEFENTVTFTPIHNETNYNPDAYDLVLKRIGAKDEDVKKVRQALLTRFMEDPRVKTEME